MTLLNILSGDEQIQFDSPPQFSGEKRKHFFSLPKWAEETVRTLRTPKSKVGFILQLGYFRASNMFYLKQAFHQRDIEYVAKRFQVEGLSMEGYDKTTLLRHRALILEKLGFKAYSEMRSTIR